MVKQFFKKKSKRQSCKIKYKVEKKVKEHRRKMKKEKKKNPKKKSRKDPGVPNSAPFKAEVVKEAERRKTQKEEERKRRREQQKLARQKEQNKRRNLSSFQADVAEREKEFEKKQQATAGGDAGQRLTKDNSVRAFYREFRKVIEMADVVLEVLDARDPTGSRCYDVEQAVLSAGTGKKLVLVLNKIDLVPKEIVSKWLTYLRNEFPTVAFKSSTQTQRMHLAHAKVKVSAASSGLMQSSRCLGASMLMKLLGNYCTSHDIRTAIRVGVVGLPNVGKSSIINSLKRGKACTVGATPGVTRCVQEVQLDSHVKLLDSPGIVMPRSADDSALRNCVKLENVKDPIPPVEQILRRCSKENMMLHYRVPEYTDVDSFLSSLAMRMGRLKKGGIPDVNKAARIVLQDWNSGKITYYTHPPEIHALPTHISAEIVKQMSEAFDLDAVKSDEEAALRGLKMQVHATDNVIETAGLTRAAEADAEMLAEDEDGEEDEKDGTSEEEEMEEDDADDETITVSIKHKTKKGGSKGLSESGKGVLSERQQKLADREALLPGNRQLNKLLKKAYKKKQKLKKKSIKVTSELADELAGAMSLTSGGSDDKYDFAVDYK